MRSLFWISKGRQTKKRVTSRCLLCKTLDGLSYSTPPQSGLLEFRVIDGTAFESAGIDLCGPAYTKIHSNSKHITKGNISFTTCATSRIIHLKVLVGKSTEVILTKSKTIHSLETTYNAKQGNKRQFSFAAAPWWGGLKGLRLFKKCLIKGIMKMTLRYVSLQQFLQRQRVYRTTVHLHTNTTMK